MEFRTSGLNPKITGCNEAYRFFIGGAKWICVIFGLFPRLFVVKLFSRNEVLCGMQGNVLSGLWKLDYPFEPESKADLTSKM
ncbi:hypothetical protein GILI108418_16070 [Gillisia limnaea]|uniref:Uncharacterized protein n=1 Tax=Gillisia limnaea (strain DSM 15749 / LMG 21470 / R-8282) TaxID=865937 RepID=H2BXS5_GILLR|nr:hypothetical protein Gilli_1433 [Gillisia limnaea DSM 15749]